MLVTQAEYARRRGVSRQAVGNALKRGIITANADGMIDTEQADLAWPPRVNGPMVEPETKHGLKVVKGGKAKEDGPGKAMAASRALHEAYKARLARLEFEEKSKMLVPVEEARTAAFNTGRRLRDLLTALPDRMASSLSMQATDVIHRMLTEEVRHLQDEVARWAKL